MKLRTLLTSAAAAAIATFAAGAAGAATITDTFTFTASGFNVGAGPSPAPVDPVTGSVTITFDPTQTYENATTGITLNSINIALDSTALSFNYSPTALSFFDGGTQVNDDAGELVIGANGSAALIPIPFSTNDFYVHVENALSSPFIQQLGYTHTYLDGVTGYYYTPTSTPITVRPGGVPEPASWLLMMAGIGGIGAMLRMATRTAGVAGRLA